MPLKSQNGNGKVASAPEIEQSGPKKFFYHHSHFGGKIILTLVGILLVYLIVLFGTMIRNNMQKHYFIGRADRPERTITISSQGKVTAKPDIAVTTMGMMTEAKTVAEAQKQNTDVMNKLVAKLKELGVVEKDIQTTYYNIYPQYDWNGGRQSLRGYQVQQSVTVKIRNLDKANQILALAGEVGTNNVSGLQFTIDDPDVYKAQAREKALEKVAEKASVLSKALGVRLASIVSYNEYSDADNIYPYRGMSEAMGVGGSAPLPTIESGSLEVVLNVDVVFEIR